MTKLPTKQDAILALAGDAQEFVSYKAGDGTWSRYDVETLLNTLRVGMNGQKCYPFMILEVKAILISMMNNTSIAIDHDDIEAVKSAFQLAEDAIASYGIGHYDANPVSPTAEEWARFEKRFA